MLQLHWKLGPAESERRFDGSGQVTYISNLNSERGKASYSDHVHPGHLKDTATSTDDGYIHSDNHPIESDAVAADEPPHYYDDP